MRLRSEIASARFPRLTMTGSSLLHQRKRPQGAAGRDVGEVRVGRLEHVDAAGAARGRHVLLAVVLPGERLADGPGGGLELPQDLSRVLIAGDELAGQLAGEDEAAGG